MFVRWDNLLVEADEARTLPGYREPAVVRTFDAPEALDTRFYEVRAKSALNRVPKASRMPFRWTINPYRGCSHACVFCMGGDTPILMADGRPKALRDLRAGDGVVGTVGVGRHRRYVTTTVHARWSTTKPAHRIILEDGTELIASGDHRFLTDRGWKYVTGSMGGPLQRPYLTTNNGLVGTGGFAAAPEESDDYRRGYLCGTVRGDGHVRTKPSDGRASNASRLALVDFEALLRIRAYLRDIAVETGEYLFQRAHGRFEPLWAIRARGATRVTRIVDAIRWPWSPSDDWRKGFLAGIYDAEGSHSQGVFRISNTDMAIIRMIVESLEALDFDFALEDPGLANGLRVVRLRGGLRERLRFFHTVDPAITRKRTIDGMAVKSDARLGVISVEPLGVEMPLYDITTGTGDFIANGVISHNCFARPTHTYLDMDAGRDFEREIVVKVNVPEVLRVELAKPGWRREHVAIGTNTDPYQWVESRYRLMPDIWAALRDSDTPCSVLTKSPLLLRDIELFKELAARVGFTANLSIPTLDEKAWRATEPRTPNPRARIEAVAELNRAGIPTGVLVAPLMPGVNDAPEQVAEILDLCAEAGATHVGGIALHLRGEVRGIFFDWLRAQRPDLVPRYEELYRRGAYAPQAERERLSALVRPRGARETGGRLTPLRGVRERDPAPERAGHEGAASQSLWEGGDDRGRPPSAPAPPRQGSLF